MYSLVIIFQIRKGKVIGITNPKIIINNPLGYGPYCIA